MASTAVLVLSRITSSNGLLPFDGGRGALGVEVPLQFSHGGDYGEQGLPQGGGVERSWWLTKSIPRLRNSPRLTTKFNCSNASSEAVEAPD